MSDSVPAISEDKVQLMAVTEFNYYPNRYIHGSWVARLENATIISRLLKRARSEDNLASYLLDRFELKDKYWFNFDTPLRQLLLRSRDDILRITMYAGAVLNSRHIREAIQTGDAMQWRRALGRRLFEFAVNEAPLDFNVAGLPTIAAPAPGADRRAQVVASGLWCLGKALEGEASALVERLYLKMAAAEYPFLAQQPDTFHKAPCVAVIEKLVRSKLPPP